MLKTLLVRSDAKGNVALQLYVKDQAFVQLTGPELEGLKENGNITGFEMIFSIPKSPASVITERLQKWGEITLTDTIGLAPNSIHHRPASPNNTNLTSDNAGPSNKKKE